MPYIVINANERVLSRETPYSLLSWLEGGVSAATDYRYAVVFETFQGASKCATMYDGLAYRIEFPAAASVGGGVDAAYRLAKYRRPSGFVEVET